MWNFNFPVLECEWWMQFSMWICCLFQGRFGEFRGKWGLCPGELSPPVVTSVFSVLLCGQDQGNPWSVTRSWLLISSRVTRWIFQLMLLWSLLGPVVISLRVSYNYKLTLQLLAVVCIGWFVYLVCLLTLIGNIILWINAIAFVAVMLLCYVL